MKKSVMFLLCLVYFQGSQLLASSFAIKVPEKLLMQKASLVLYMLDELGNQCIGKCQLDQNSASRKISQCELQITTSVEVELLPDVIDLMISHSSSEQEVVLHFEFDRSMAILRILVVKDTLLEEDPFNVLSFPIGQHSSVEDVDQFDEFSSLVENVDTTRVETSMKKSKNNRSMFAQYMVYAEIFALLQYGRAKRAMSNVASWFAPSSDR